MVTIPGIPAPTLGATTRRRRMHNPGFEVPDAPETPAAAPAATASLAGMLAMQEAAGAEAADRAAQRHGEAVMQDLQSLQLALLRGGSGAAAHLAFLARNAPPAADPRLAAVLAAIRLRAEVECARPQAMRRESDTENQLQQAVDTPNAGLGGTGLRSYKARNLTKG